MMTQSPTIPLDDRPLIPGFDVSVGAFLDSDEITVGWIPPPSKPVVSRALVASDDLRLLPVRLLEDAADLPVPDELVADPIGTLRWMVDARFRAGARGAALDDDTLCDRLIAVLGIDCPEDVASDLSRVESLISGFTHKLIEGGVDTVLRSEEAAGARGSGVAALILDVTKALAIYRALLANQMTAARGSRILNRPFDGHIEPGIRGTLTIGGIRNAGIRRPAKAFHDVCKIYQRNKARGAETLSEGPALTRVKAVMDANGLGWMQQHEAEIVRRYGPRKAKSLSTRLKSPGAKARQIDRAADNLCRFGNIERPRSGGGVYPNFGAKRIDSLFDAFSVTEQMAISCWRLYHFVRVAIAASTIDELRACLTTETPPLPCSKAEIARDRVAVERTLTLLALYRAALLQDPEHLSFATRRADALTWSRRDLLSSSATFDERLFGSAACDVAPSRAAIEILLAAGAKLKAQDDSVLVKQRHRHGWRFVTYFGAKRVLAEHPEWRNKGKVKH